MSENAQTKSGVYFEDVIFSGWMEEELLSGGRFYSVDRGNKILVN